PGGDELVGIEVDDVLAQQLEQLRRVLGRQVPIENHLAVVDRHDLDPVEPAPVGHERGLEPAARDDQLVGAVGPHCSASCSASAAAASSIECRTSSPTAIAGSARTPAAAARARARSSPSVTERRPMPLSTAVGCISQAAAAISTVLSSPSSRPPANSWRKQASENATARP